MFSFKNKEIKQLFQWDKDIVLVFDSKYINQEVHFSNNKKNALVKDIDENGEVSIPNSLLTENKPIEVYLFLDDNYTKERRILKIIPRPKPDDYVYTEEEIKKYEDLEKRLNNILVMQNKAQVGQIIKVAAIDEDGKPTAWEAVDPMVVQSSTEGSTKKFKLSVDDNGTLSTTNTTDNTNEKIATEGYVDNKVAVIVDNLLPDSTEDDNDKILSVVGGIPTWKEADSLSITSSDDGAGNVTITIA